MYQGWSWLSPFGNWALYFACIKKWISVLCITLGNLLLERAMMKSWEIENYCLGLFFLRNCTHQLFLALSSYAV